MDRNPPLLDLPTVPLNKLPILLLEGRSSSGNEHTAQAVGLLIDLCQVAPGSENHGAFHTADATADDGDALGFIGPLDAVLLGLHGPGVQGAAGHVNGIHQILVVGGPLVAGHGEAGVVTADAGLDVLLPLLHELGDPGGVGEELPGHAHGIDPAGGNGGGTLCGLHASGADHGDIHKLLDVAYILQVAVEGHVCRGMSPVPGVIGTVVAVEHIVARILEELGGNLRLLHVPAYLLVVIALLRQSALAEALGLGHHGVPQRHGEVLPAAFLDSLHDIGGKAVAVLQAPAVLVGALVGILGGKLVQGVALVDRVDLDAVHPCVHAELSSFGKGLYDLVDLLHSQRPGVYAVGPAVGGGRGAGGDEVHVKDGLSQGAQDLVVEHLHHQVIDSHSPAEACGDLDKELCPGLVELLHVVLQGLELSCVLVQPAAAHGIPDGGDAG